MVKPIKSLSATPSWPPEAAIAASSLADNGICNDSCFSSSPSLGRLLPAVNSTVLPTSAIADSKSIAALTDAATGMPKAANCAVLLARLLPACDCASPIRRPRSTERFSRSCARCVSSIARVTRSCSRLKRVKSILPRCIPRSMIRFKRSWRAVSCVVVLPKRSKSRLTPPSTRFSEPSTTAPIRILNDISAIRYPLLICLLVLRGYLRVGFIDPANKVCYYHLVNFRRLNMKPLSQQSLKYLPLIRRHYRY